jgi:hypothetical protein
MTAFELIAALGQLAFMVVACLIIHRMHKAGRVQTRQLITDDGKTIRNDLLTRAMVKRKDGMWKALSEEGAR